jgi:hypothetical protein
MFVDIYITFYTHDRKPVVLRIKPTSRTRRYKITLKLTFYRVFLPTSMLVKCVCCHFYGTRREALANLTKISPQCKERFERGLTEIPFFQFNSFLVKNTFCPLDVLFSVTQLDVVTYGIEVWGAITYGTEVWDVVLRWHRARRQMS